MPRNMEEKTGIYAQIPADLCRDVKLLLMDPKTGRVGYGKMAALITKLLQNWRDGKRKGQSVEEPSPNIDRFKEIENG